MRRTKAPRDHIDTMCPCVLVPPHLLSVLPWPPLSQSFPYPAYCSFLTCSSHCCRINWVPQPHHVPVRPSAMQTWCWGWAHPTAVSGATAGSALPASPPHPRGKDPSVQEVWGPWQLGYCWPMKTPRTEVFGDARDHLGHPPIHRDPVISDTHPTPGESIVQLIFNCVSFNKKLNIAKKKRIFINIELNNVSVCHTQYVFKLTHCIQLQVLTANGQNLLCEIVWF